MTPCKWSKREAIDRIKPQHVALHFLLIVTKAELFLTCNLHQFHVRNVHVHDPEYPYTQESRNNEWMLQTSTLDCVPMACNRTNHYSLLQSRGDVHHRVVHDDEFLEKILDCSYEMQMQSLTYIIQFVTSV